MKLSLRLFALSTFLVLAGCPTTEGNQPPVATGASLTTAEDTPFPFTLSANDPEGKTLTITPGAPSHGTITGSGASFVYTPAADFFGLDTISFTVTDGTTEVKASVDFTVTPVNDAPVAVADALMGSANVESTFEPSLLLANDTDIDGDALAVTAVSNASAGTVALVGGRITYQPVGLPGDVTFSYTLSDGTATATGTVTLTLASTLRAPVAVDDTVSTDEDVVLALQASSLISNDLDLDGDTLSLTAVSNAMHGTVALASGVITFSPDAEFSGTASFDYTVSDGALTDTGSVTITVVDVNDAPLATDDLANTNEDTAVTLALTTLLANDLDVDGMVTITAVSNATNGTVALSGASIVFTPTAQFNGTAGFDYTLSDGMLTDTGRVTVSVSAMNDAPVATPDSATTAEDTSLALSVSTLLANDSDPEAQQLSITSVQSAVRGTVTLAGNTVTFVPESNYVGAASFAYTVTDGTDTASAVVSITVTAVNDAPVAVADARTGTEDVVLTLTAASLLANDSDVEGSALTLTAVGNATHGTVALAAGTITFTPESNFVGDATFEYTVSDGALTSTAVVTIALAGANDAPVAVDDMRTTAEDTALTATAASLISNDTDPENATLTLTAVSNATNGTVALSGTDVVFTPTANFNGTAGFDYTVSDGALTDTGHVTITVSAANDAPTGVADTATTSEDTLVTFSDAALLANDSDVDGQALSITAVGNAVNGNVSRAAGITSFTPSVNFSGTSSFEYTVSDGALTATVVVTITVTAVNDAPIAVDDTASVNESAVLTLGTSVVLGNDTDVEGSALSVSSVSGATNGSVSLSGSTITFVPTPGFNGTAGFDYAVSDGALTDTGRVTVSVGAVNDPPVAVDDSSTTSEDTQLTLTDAALLINDTDPDGPSLSVIAVGNPVNGTVSRSLGVITFTPSVNFAGTASFEYSVSDGTLTDVGVVTVTVTAVNDAPTAVDDLFTTAEDTALIVPGATLFSNDLDVDGPSLSVTAVGNAVGGTVSLSAGTITFTPAADFAGAAGFEYTVSDGAATDVGAVEVTVTPVDDVPVANADSATTNEDTLVDVSVLGNDTGLGDGSLVVTITGAATSGSATVQSGNVVRYTPNGNFSGSDSFTYQVADGDGDVATATVSVTVSAVNDAPVATAQSVSTNEGAPLLITLAATDVDSATLTFSIVSGPTSGTLGTVTSTGPTTATVTYTPTGTFFGADSFTFAANDTALNSAAATVDVTVSNVIACGDGNLEGTEQCDTVGTPVNGDGCSSTCTVETGWNCAGAPSVCSTTCGDTVAVGAEECDDGNMVETDGCTTQCKSGRVCSTVGFAGGAAYATNPATGTCYANFSGPTTWASAQSSCLALGGHLVAITSAAEQAVVSAVVVGTPWMGATDDANDTDAVFDWVTTDAWGYTNFAAGEPDDDFGVGGNGECLAFVGGAQWVDTNCNFVGYTDGRVCEFAPNPCGDGVLHPGEVCDDGNSINGDGCDNNCTATACGNGVMSAGEACDDGNANAFDGCSATCTIQSGATCSGTAPTTCSKLVINEIDYDQSGADSIGPGYEYVEILNVGTAAANVSDVALVLINGSSNSEYFFDNSTGAGNVSKRIQLSSAGAPGNLLAPGGFIVVSVAGLTTPVGVFRINVTAPSTGFLQNGAPDAVALVRLGTMTSVLDGFSYEGSVAASTLAGVTGTFTITEGTGPALADTGASATDSMARSPNGQDTDANSTDFVVRAVGTPGAAN